MDDSLVPPSDLMYLVTGDADVEKFLRTGMVSCRDLEAALARHGHSLGDFDRILDFGVGLGRVARHLGDVKSLAGCDVMPDLISWCQNAIPFGEYVVNDEFPPLPFSDGKFSLCFSHSVFTHLDVTHQDLWLQELFRVLRPGGLAVLSFNGNRPFQHYLESLRTAGAADRAVEHEADFERDGYKWIMDDEWVNTSFPGWYHSMFHSPQYVLKHWARIMPVESWMQQGNLGFQDTAVLRRGPE